MTNDEMKAAIERVREYSITYMACIPPADLEVTLALAEVGRLAVGWARAGRTPGRVDDYIAAETEAVNAADAFLAKHGGRS